MIKTVQQTYCLTITIIHWLIHKRPHCAQYAAIAQQENITVRPVVMVVRVSFVVVYEKINRIHAVFNVPVLLTRTNVINADIVVCANVLRRA